MRPGLVDCASFPAVFAGHTSRKHPLRDVVADEYGAIMYPSRVRSARVVPYSPGYCGWNVTGQARLFERLRPAEIGIWLNERCLMEPTKSVSGVLIAARRDLHVFRPTFPCCEACSTRDCSHRMAVLRTSE